MKLWAKISMICAVVLLLIVGTCSILLLLTARSKILNLAIHNAKSQQMDLQNSFREMVLLYGSDDLGPVEKRSLVKYCFRNFTDDTSVLISSEDTLYSNISFDPEAALPLPDAGEQNYIRYSLDGMEYLIVGAKLGLYGDAYSIYTVRDITDVDKSIAQLIYQFGAISSVSIAAGTILIMMLMRYATRPLKKLGATVRRIARGEYSERADVSARDEVGELAQDFNRMAEAVEHHVAELREVAQRQQFFIGGLTHEYKTPLTSVIGHSETLLYTKMPQETVERSLIHIHEQCAHLERLTQKLLRLITLEEGIQKKRQPVGDLLEAVRAGTSEAMERRGIRLDCRCEVDTLPMDFDLMVSLLSNLVENAAKASVAGQTVILRAHDHAFEVTDHGIGIPEEDVARVFEPFYMVDKSRSKQMGGVGLGLALVKRIADAHGARIDIQSAPAAGTTVRVILPDDKTFTTQ